MKPRVKIPTQLSRQDFRIVKNNGVLDKDAPLLFTFSNFKMSPINIDGVFNNYFGDETEYISWKCLMKTVQPVSAVSELIT